MGEPGPAIRYYQAMHGAWRGRFSFTITSRRLFRGSPVGTLDRLRLRAMDVQCRLGIPIRMETTMDARSRAERNEVLHTTRVSALGMTLLRGAETLTLHPDGLSATLRGDQRLWPMLGRARPWSETPVRIDEDASGAHYTFSWLGETMIQRTRVEPQGLRLTQETPWSRAEVLLERVR